MSLNNTPSSERIHIGFFGKRNAGKSSVVNRVTGQELSVVSDVKGTTTDPVSKAMELLPMGPVQIIDTPGIDDEGSLGELRVKKTKQILNKTDIAILVADATAGLVPADYELISIFKNKNIPYIVAMNKTDLIETNAGVNENDAKNLKNSAQDIETENIKAEQIMYVSAVTGSGIHELKEKISQISVTNKPDLRIAGDLINPSDFVVLVVPIDSAAPKGRLILPQQQTIRDILESDATAIVIKENKLKNTLANLGKKPKLVITDSQVFESVSKDTPLDISLTSFSILFARYKGNLAPAVKGASAIKKLKDGDLVLISEGCTHHRQCDDIGSVKIPAWLKKYTGADINIDLSSGIEFPEDLSPYSLIIHCGGCMLNEREMKYRQKCAEDQNVPITNYGIAIAFMQGILERSIEIFPDISEKLKE
ncbi:MAG: [FeFe] hydrogenase H-cluster maturation GTPase HydF [Firmicutes bacterium]|nr:[FeFe] hydrogenase H-cluster maturation GTPase HydF [Bacillota bacterium]